MFGTPAASTARTISSPSAAFMASGFSQIIILPALAAAIAISLCAKFGTQMSIRSISLASDQLAANPFRRARSPRCPRNCFAFSTVDVANGLQHRPVLDRKEVIQPPVCVRVRAAHEAAADETYSQVSGCHRTHHHSRKRDDPATLVQ